MDRQHSGGRPASRKSSRHDSEGLFDWNLGTDRIHFSPRWLALIGCDDHEVGSEPDDWFGRVHPDDRASLLGRVDAVRTGDTREFDCRYRLRHKDGTYRWMVCHGTAGCDSDGRAVRLTGSQADVTVEMVTDRLTGLPNGLLLTDRVSHSIERARRQTSFHFAVLMIDIGRPATNSRPPAAAKRDPLLTAAARRLETCLRNPALMPSLGRNDLVARLEDDDFAILLDGLKDVGDAKVAADRILGELLQPILLGGREVRLAPSVGVAVSATGYSTADAMVHDAQVAQHRARMLGGSHCEIFDTAILKSEQAELQLEQDFDTALLRGEFVLMFQPIVRLDSNQVIGFEALVRWRHPALGLVPPNDFIPLAEKTGFIVPLGNWIVREACVRLRQWDAALPEAHDVSVSVNISSVQASDPALVDHVAAVLRDTGLEPRRLVLELTEGLAMANPAAITTLLMQLRAIGVRISIDDFGTGYSSLAYLRQFPIDTLKIDRSFVRGMVSNRDTAEIVAGVMNMAQQLGLQVVAEGIERDDQCERLRTLKCDAGQGTLFAGPLDVDAAAEFLRTGLARGSEGETTRVAGWDAIKAGLFVRARHLAANPRASFAAALALLVSIGLIGVVAKAAARGRSVAQSQQAASDTSTSAAAVEAAPVMAGDIGGGVEHGATASQPAPLSVVPSEVAPAKPKAAPPAPAPSPAAATQIAAVTPVTKPPIVASATPTAPTTIAASPSVVVGATATGQLTSLQVVHLHRLGSCHGRLDVTRDGVAFVSDSDGEDDAFTLKYADFLNALTDDTLILRSATRTYRFKTGSGSDSKVQLQALAEAIARARR